jgi:Flp pilus assembly pilin Flp
MFTPHPAPTGGRRSPLQLSKAVRAFVHDEAGQDVIEYGLLSAFFGIVCIAVWIVIQGNLRDAYINYDTDVQGLWASPDPGGT